MNTIRYNSFSGKDGRNWLNLVFIGEHNVCQWFGEVEKAPIDINKPYEILSIVTNGKYAVVNLVAEDNTVVPVFVKTII